MATTIGPGMGCTLKIVAQLIGEVVSMSGPTYTRAVIDTTHLGSTDDFKTKMKGISSTEMGFSVQFNAGDQGHIDLMKEVEGTESGVNATLKAFTVALKNDATPSTFVITGAISACAFGGMDVDGKVTAELSITFSGTPNFSE